MILFVCGGRDYSDRAKIYKLLDKVHEHRHIDMIVNGDCDGADKMSTDWAKANGVQPCLLPALWAALGNSAGPIRNSKAVELIRIDGAAAFGGGRGTGDAVKKLKKAGVRVWEIDRE